jgi:hypothetical protein
MAGILPLGGQRRIPGEAGTAELGELTGASEGKSDIDEQAEADETNGSNC